jgi:hypothetical protein
LAAENAKAQATSLDVSPTSTEISAATVDNGSHGEIPMIDDDEVECEVEVDDGEEEGYF